MQDNTPSVGFEAGEPAKTPYIKIALFAVFGVIATVILMSMLVKPKFYASLMGANVNDYVASSDSLTRVAANAPISGSPTPAISISPYPTISGFISPTITPIRTSVTPPKPSTTQAPLQLSFLRILYKDGQPQMTGPNSAAVKYECGDLIGNSVTGRISLNVQTPVNVTTSNAVWLYECIFDEMLPPAPVGYMWLKSYQSVYSGVSSKNITFVDRLVSVNKIQPTSTPIKTPTPAIVACATFSCDINRDTKIDALDKTFLTSCFGKGPGNLGACITADVNSREQLGKCDGYVDILDNSYFGSKCFTSPTPMPSPFISISPTLAISPTPKLYQLTAVSPYVPGASGTVTMSLVPMVTGMQGYKITSASFGGGLVPGRQYQINVCVSNQNCSTNADLKLTASQTGTALWSGISVVTVNLDMGMPKTISLFETYAQVPVPTNVPSCQTSPCMSANL